MYKFYFFPQLSGERNKSLCQMLLRTGISLSVIKFDGLVYKSLRV